MTDLENLERLAREATPGPWGGVLQHLKYVVAAVEALPGLIAEVRELRAARGTERDACPCRHTTPCNPQCTCVTGFSSYGCNRCCSYGSKEQQRAMAEALAEKDEPGALLAEVEAKWPHPRYDIHISRNEEPGPTWSVTVEDYAEEHGCGEGETFPAALRDLLGVDGG